MVGPYIQTRSDSDCYSGTHQRPAIPSHDCFFFQIQLCSVQIRKIKYVLMGERRQCVQTDPATRKQSNEVEEKKNSKLSQM